MKRNLLILVLGCILGLYQPLNAQDAENVVNGHEYVDLALPSGLKWATCNIGASKPEAYGSCFAWGETKPKYEYTQANSVTYGKDMDDISGNAQYDAAIVNWGDGWRMPTKDDMQELLDNCIWEWIIYKGIRGYNVTGINGNSIFLPAAGYKGASCNGGEYWSSTPCTKSNQFAFCLNFTKNDYNISSYLEHYRFSGRVVRCVSDLLTAPTAVITVETITEKTSIIKTYVSSSGEITERGFYYGINPELSEADNKVVLENEVGYKVNALFGLTPNTTYYIKSYATNSEGTSYSEVVSFTTLENPKEYEYVDLGLPSGLKWATHNIGATTAEEYGNYYAWGEVFTKDEYTEANSLTSGKTMNDISGDAQYDAATFNWSGDWRMPTRTEMQELIDNCSWTWTTQNGVNGCKVTSKLNSNYIFLPAAGYRNGASLTNAGHSGHYWSSSPSGNYSAYHLYFNSTSHSVKSNNRYNGYSIRPVRE